ncbi:hypothetical protein DC3_22600 [Deinococcus cellulosilyticus NBRC 106333 = KACC 11606]|uniref:Uncharacterized protein n=1 Tax=Deinococcus cellulosilyticus (strain DSM 18568 / NBRC 106333 / KACC 11606 / 5516J-15) TaxID=1223518 RepID=A0A511N172_DEIC1|nr:hypothetical protein DC3_22600 [Deinococcus cellulosilyticus NBRC 106333 = KACC 11606]
MVCYEGVGRMGEQRGWQQLERRHVGMIFENRLNPQVLLLVAERKSTQLRVRLKSLC